MLIESYVSPRSYVGDFRENAAVSTKPHHQRVKPVADSDEPKSLEQLVAEESCRRFVRGVEKNVVPKLRQNMAALFDDALGKCAPSPR